MLEVVKKAMMLELVKKKMMLFEKKKEFVCEYNGDTMIKDAEKALRDGRMCGQWWKRGNSWCGGSKVKYSCRNTTSLKTIYTKIKQFIIRTKHFM